MQLPDRFRNFLPPRLRQVLAGDARQDLVESVASALLLFDQQLVLLDSDQQVSVPGSDAAALAEAARQLLPEANKTTPLVLLLPPEEFVATTRAMPGITGESLASAMALQVDALLPACEEPLALAINPASVGLVEDHIALWMHQARLDDLFSAFADQGLYLVAARPRVLAVATGDVETRILDQSASGVTAVALQQGVLTQWLQVDAADLEQTAFAEQWQQELKSHPTAQRLEFSSSQDYFSATPATGNATANPPYHFFPAGALQAQRKVQQGQRLMAAAAAAVVVILLSAVPFLIQSLQLRSVQGELAANRELASAARADQQAVVAFENQWGAIDDFPEQDIRQVMFTLQDALAPDQLTMLEVSEGLISIEGTSDDPQAILQRLEQDPLFTEVVFARATNNTRYYIDLRLSPVNFEGYMRRYFPDD